MTARVCPVHGEYAADGICRWCEPEETPAQELARVNAGVIGESPGASALRDAQILATYERKYLERIGYLLPATTYMGAPVVVDPHASSDAPPMLVNWRPPAPRYPLVNYLPPEYDHTEAVIDAETHAAEESRLLAQHAALRWERVARRWATKAKFDGHERTVDGTLAFDDRCSECRRTKRLTDAGIPKEWP